MVTAVSVITVGRAIEVVVNPVIAKLRRDTARMTGTLLVVLAVRLAVQIILSTPSSQISLTEVTYRMPTVAVAESPRGLAFAHFQPSNVVEQRRCSSSWMWPSWSLHFSRSSSSWWISSW